MGTRPVTKPPDDGLPSSGASNNFLSGLGGDDTLVGGAGNDTLAGGSGADTHVFTGAFGQDTVTDFYAAAGLSDVIRFTTDGASRSRMLFEGRTSDAAVTNPDSSSHAYSVFSRRDSRGTPE